jgi:serine/threonine protein kinase
MAHSAIGPGAVLAGRFRLEDLLDESSGAGFWRATDLVLARNVAVHVLPDTDPRAQPLLDGARSSALVSDPRLLRVLDAAASDGLVYVVNEWGSGVSLDRLVVDAPLAPRRAAWLVKEVADAITNAHRHGVAHGRLLPEHVLVSETGSVKLIGFVVDALLRSPEGARRSADGAVVTAQQADVLDLAGLLYAALVGRWPGTEGSLVPPAPVEHGRLLRPRQVRAGVPRPLDAICDQVLNAGARPGSTPITTAYEVAAALADFVGDPVASSAWGPAALEPTAAMDRSDVPDSSDLDPEATQAGAPVFGDEDSTVAWRPVGGHAPNPQPVTARHPSPEPRRGSQFADARTVAARTGPGPSPMSTPISTPISTPTPTPTAASGAGHAAWGPDGGSARPGSSSDRLPGQAPERTDDLEDAPLGGTAPRRRRRAPVALAAVALVVAASVAQGLGLGIGDGIGGLDGDAKGTTPRATTQGGTPMARQVQIKGVTDFDPLADPPEENPDLAPLAADGKPGTAWQTVTYRNKPTLGGLKEGVGLLVDLGAPARVGQVRLRLDGRGTALQILAAAPDADAAPASTEGLRTVAADQEAGRRVTLDLAEQVRTRWLVVWLTSLPTAPGGYQGRVAEISVRS